MPRQLRRMLPVWWILPTLQVYPAKVCTRECIKGQSLNLIHPTYGMQPIRYSTNRTWLRLAPDGHLVAIQTFYSKRRRHRQRHRQRHTQIHMQTDIKPMFCSGLFLLNPLIPLSNPQDPRHFHPISTRRNISHPNGTRLGCPNPPQVSC